MGRMIFDLTDEDRGALEALRIKMGLRSHAETLRALIRGGDGGAPAPASPAAPKPSFSHGRGKTVVAAPKRQRVDAPSAPGKKLIGFTTSGEEIYR